MESSTSSSTKPKPTFQLQSQDEHKIVHVPSSRHSRRLSIERPHNGKPISKIICSPRMKYAGTWSNDDKSVILWSIVTGQQRLKYENEISRTSITEPNTLSAVSDNMHVVIKTNSYHLNFEMFEMMNKQKPSLRFPNSRNVIDRSEFTRNGDFVTVSSFPSYRAFIFTPTTPSDSTSEIEWILTSMLELSYFSDSFITIYGNLILFNDKTFQLINWNIETLKLQTNCPIDWSYVPDLVEVTEDEELLGICAKNYTEQDDEPGTSRIYVYSTMNGMNLATYDYDSSISIDKIYFIAHEIGEPMNIESYGSRYNIDHLEQEETYKGRLLKWELDCQFLKSFILKAFHFNHEGNEWLPVQGKSQRNIFPNFHSEIQDRPQLLYYWGNEDFYYQELTYTKLSYNDTFAKRILPPPEFDIVIKFKELSFGPEGSKDVSYYFKELIEDYITNKFSIIYYGSIIMNSLVKMNADLMIEKLCESCFEFNFKPNSDINNISTSNIQLLSIIVQIFPELLQKDPNYLAGFLSRTAFVIPFIDQSPLRVREKPSIFHSSHLYQHGTYNYLSKTSIINIFISRIYERWKHFQYDQYKHRFDNNKNFSIYSFIETYIIIPFQNCFYTVHVNKLRNLVRIIQNDKWNGFEKPYLSPAILKVIKVEYDNFSKNKQVEIEIGEIKELIMRLRDDVGEIDE
ncbi:44703_t:CDS:2 [Gigaspora margarita]|uniref:44703_t:CDS:1 n=1 Tax=Gigaspora margarita TaxID=4874 RepID=A0ABN7UEC4_GIGMA|nr:44703_t:CDS:2 [Gigaspora margarita]